MVEWGVLSEAEVNVPITLSCCSHVRRTCGLTVGDEREVRVPVKGRMWVFKRARVVLDDKSCDCESEA